MSATTAPARPPSAPGAGPDRGERGTGRHRRGKCGRRHGLEEKYRFLPRRRLPHRLPYAGRILCFHRCSLRPDAGPGGRAPGALCALFQPRNPRSEQVYRRSVAGKYEEGRHRRRTAARTAPAAARRTFCQSGPIDPDPPQKCAGGTGPGRGDHPDRIEPRPQPRHRGVPAHRHSGKGLHRAGPADLGAHPERPAGLLCRWRGQDPDRITDS